MPRGRPWRVGMMSRKAVDGIMDSRLIPGVACHMGLPTLPGIDTSTGTIKCIFKDSCKVFLVKYVVIY